MMKKTFSFPLLYLAIAIITTLGCKTSTYVADIDTSYERIDRYDKEDNDMLELIAPYKAQLDEKMYEVIARLPEDLSKGKPNSGLGSWFTDIIAIESKRISGKEIAFAAQNYGGLRLPTLAAGDITVSDIYELMPFDNKIVILEVDSTTIQQFFDMVASHGGWPISDEVRFKIDKDKAVNITLSGAPLENDKVYYIALPDYIANGGDNADFLIDQKKEDYDVFIRDLVIDYLRNLPENQKDQDTHYTKRIN